MHVARSVAPALVAGLLSTAVLMSPGASARARGSCDAHRAIKRTASALVYGRVIGEDGYGNKLRALYACIRPAGAPHLVSIASLPGDDDIYPPDERLLGLGIGGRYVGAWVRSGAGSASVCAKYAQPNCPTTTVRLVVVDARTGRRTRTFVTGDPKLPAPLLSARGALAYLDSDPQGVVTLHATRLRAVGARGLSGASEAVDAGAIVPGSVRLAGLRLSWVKDGAPRSSVVSPSGQ